jgi:hypothetical protein
MGLVDSNLPTKRSPSARNSLWHDEGSDIQTRSPLNRTTHDRKLTGRFRFNLCDVGFVVATRVFDSEALADLDWATRSIIARWQDRNDPGFLYGIHHFERKAGLAVLALFTSPAFTQLTDAVFGMPLRRMKESGLGCELGIEGLDAYMESKYVSEALRQT